MARAGMSDEEMTTFLKETFCVDSTFTAAALFTTRPSCGAKVGTTRARGGVPADNTTAR